MTKLTARAVIYLILAVIGVLFIVYSVKIRNYALLVISILFALVSADNIFCNLKKSAK